MPMGEQSLGELRTGHSKLLSERRFLPFEKESENGSRTGAPSISLTSMKFQLKCLHRNGIVLTPEELADAPRYTGNLVIEDWPQGGMFGRFIRQARLLDVTPPKAPPDIIPPLFEPQLVKMTDSLMTLHGYQIYVDPETGAIQHYAQDWVLRIAADE